MRGRQNRRGAKQAREAASAYLAVMLCLIVLAGTTVAFVGLIASQSASAHVKRQSARAYYVAEAGMNAALAELNATRDYGGDGLGTATGNVGGGAYHVTAVQNAPNDYTLTSVGTYGTERRSIEVVAQRPTAEFDFNALAAIVSNGPVRATGTITIDGRDHNINGVLTGAAGVWGVVCSSSVVRAGSAAIGGNGVAPSNSSNIFQQFYSWANGVNEDLDGATDEEAFDGIDNDADGKIDEDVNGYPTDPDVALGLPTGMLKQIAQASGTYFASVSAFDAYRIANGGSLPGGKIIYLEVDEWLPAEVGTTLNSEPSILVVHNATNNAVVKNVHGRFKGLLLADWIVHINSNSEILGAIMSFAPQYYGTIYGNGNADVYYSSEVLSHLPSNPLANHFLVRSWREVPAE